MEVLRRGLILASKKTRGQLLTVSWPLLQIKKSKTVKILSAVEGKP
jgi:hypothetical protein